LECSTCTPIQPDNRCCNLLTPCSVYFMQITSIPNAKVSQDKVVNFSRVPVSQVEQKLRFHLEDVDELPAVLDTIRSEIRASCPKVIVDGSRPFRVFFTNYAENSLEVMVDTHFAISPTR
jgi:small-conductance mechanosensitive channel